LDGGESNWGPDTVVFSLKSSSSSSTEAAIAARGSGGGAARGGAIEVAAIAAALGADFCADGAWAAPRATAADSHARRARG